MGKDINQQNLLIGNLKNSVLQDNWAIDDNAATISAQKSQLNKMFTVVQENNITSAEKKELINKMAQLKAKIEALEASMKTIAEEIKEKEVQIKQKSDEIAAIITSVEQKSQNLKTKTKAHVKNVIADVFYEYSKGIIKKDEISMEMRVRIQNFGGTEQSEIQTILSNLKSKKAQVDALTGDSVDLIDRANLLQNKYSLTKSSYELLGMTIAQIGETETNYTNSDTNTDLPIYSLDKADIVSNYADDQSINVLATNSNYSAGNAPTPKENKIGEVETKYKDFLKKEASTAEFESISNAATNSLRGAINKGLLSDLSKSGANNHEILAFLATNFSGAGITLSQDGNSLSIPNGHGDEAIATYDSLAKYVNSLGASAFKTDVDKTSSAGNTIQSNNQLKALAGNYESILDKMGKTEPKFTFKEAMFALFDPEKGLFKDSGITYDLSKQNGSPKYSIAGGGDEETAQFYQKFADKVYDIWQVKAEDETHSATSTRRTGTRVPTPTVAASSDPLSFRTADGKENVFIIDRNDDGKFTGLNEFVGAQKGQTWLDDLKSLDADNNGVLEGDELKDLKILSSEYTDNAKFSNRSETTNISYSMSNAQNFGIESINLKDLENNVNKSQNKFDVNGSEIFNDSFTFKMKDGTEITASRKDETNQFMNAVYGKATNKNFEIGFTKEQVDEIIAKNENSLLEKFGVNLNEFRLSLAYLLGFDSLYEDAKATYQEALDQIDQDKNLQLRLADNRAAALKTNVRGWGDIKNEVIKMALKDGIPFDEEQVRGIFARTGGSAIEVYNDYKDLIEQQEKLLEESEQLKLATQILAACVQEGLSTRMDDVKKLIEDKNIKSVDEALEILKTDKKEEKK